MRAHSLLSFTLILVLLYPLLAQAQWVTTGRDAMYTMYLPQAKKPETNAIFIVSYERERSCLPAVSVMLVSGRKLGPPERQTTVKKRKDQLSIVVDGRVFSGETKLTIYSNGMELAMFAPAGLVEAMSKQPTSVVARLGTGLGSFDFSDGRGFSAANAAAYAKCN